MEHMLENKYSHFSSADNVNGNHGGGGHFTVDDYFDFSNNDETMTDAFFESLVGNSGDSSTVTAVDSCNSSASGGGQINGGCRSFNESSHFSGNELCVPYDDIAELEWLSNFVEDSFSSGNLRFIPTSAVGTTKITDASSSSSTTHSPPPSIFPSEVPVPGKARSKRSRAAPCDWSSRLLVVSAHSKTTAPSKRREPTETPGRKCLHCASEKTPQWRTGPLGPKTLCNACGVRYKSGRLVTEYRPAASPTFVSTRHSNSHKKVLELRRQKELHGQQQHQQLIDRDGSIFNGCDEFLVHQHGAINGPDLRCNV